MFRQAVPLCVCTCACCIQLNHYHFITESMMISRDSTVACAHYSFRLINRATAVYSAIRVQTDINRIIQSIASKCRPRSFSAVPWLWNLCFITWKNNKAVWLPNSEALASFNHSSMWGWKWITLTAYSGETVTNNTEGKKSDNDIIVWKETVKFISKETEMCL